MSSSDSELEFTSTTKGKGSKKKNKNKNRKSRSPAPPPAAAVSAPAPVVVAQISSLSEDSSSDDGYGKQQALGIDPAELQNYDGTSAPQNGSQYLLSVIQETKKAPKVVSVEVCKNGLGSSSSSKAKPVNYLDSFHNEVNCDVLLKVKESNPYHPTTEWRDEKLKEFSLLRSKIEQMRGLIATGATRIKVGESFKFPETMNRVVWLRFCFGLKFEKLVCKSKETEVKSILLTYFKDLKLTESETESNPQEHVTANSAVEVGSPCGSNKSSVNTSDAEKSEMCNLDGCKPLMSLMLLLSQLQIRQLIDYQSEWITKYGFVNKCQGEWLYALLSCVEKPLEPSSMASIRMICKSLIIIRNNFTSKINNENKVDVCNDNGKEEDDEGTEKVPVTVEMQDLSIESDIPENSEFINSLNLFIYLIADYFCQKDLVTELC